MERLQAIPYIRKYYICVHLYHCPSKNRINSMKKTYRTHPSLPPVWTTIQCMRWYIECYYCYCYCCCWCIQTTKHGQRTFNQFSHFVVRDAHYNTHTHARTISMSPQFNHAYDAGRVASSLIPYMSVRVRVCACMSHHSTKNEVNIWQGWHSIITVITIKQILFVYI